MLEFLKLSEVVRYEDHESDVQTLWNPIGLPGTNGNRSRGRIPSYAWLKEQLKSIFTYYTGGGLQRVDTSKNRTEGVIGVPEGRRRTTNRCCGDVNL